MITKQAIIITFGVIFGGIGLYYCIKFLAIITCKIADATYPSSFKIQEPINELSYGSLRGKPRMIEMETKRLYVMVNDKKHYVDN